MFGFAHNWINMIMQCVSSVRYSFMLRGKPRGFVILTRGLRQRDIYLPISSFYVIWISKRRLLKVFVLKQLAPQTIVQLALANIVLFMSTVFLMLKTPLHLGR